MRHHLVASLLLLCAVSLQAQDSNTVGVLKYVNPTDGYNLLFPHNQPHVFLINNCGEVVHRWDDADGVTPGNVAYILEDGTLVKAKATTSFGQETFGAGGAGGIIEWRTWDNELLHSFEFADSQYRAHHDLAVLPNGNVLAIVWERIPIAEVVDRGGDLRFHPVTERWPDLIVELDPMSDSIVWQWRAWDHLVQDYDSTKANYGVIADHPHRIDINTELFEFGLRPDWMHVNAIDYNAELDHILLSVPHFNEMWIIDHSTTTEEAATGSGGRSGRGGDLLFRWGNPAAYGQGAEADQQAFFLHDTRWVESGIPNYAGSITFFNNRVGPDSSQVDIIMPVWDENTGQYLMKDGRWLPEEGMRTITHPEMSIFSSGLSGAQILHNGNALISVGREGLGFEITPADEVVWEYKVPLKAGQSVDQGSLLTTNDNITFRINKYLPSYPAFEGRDLTPRGTLEGMPNLDFCTITAVGDLSEDDAAAIIAFPNPVIDRLWISTEVPKQPVMVYDIFGKLRKVTPSDGNDQLLDVSSLDPGIYWLKVGRRVQKFIKQNY